MKVFADFVGIASLLVLCLTHCCVAQLCSPGVKLLTLASNKTAVVVDAVSLAAANETLGEWQSPTFVPSAAWYSATGFFGDSVDIRNRNVTGNEFYARYTFRVDRAVALSCVRRLFVTPYVAGGVLSLSLNGATEHYSVNATTHDALLGTTRDTLTDQNSLFVQPTKANPTPYNVLTMHFVPFDDTVDSGDWLFDVTSQLDLGLEFMQGTIPPSGTSPVFLNVMITIGILLLLVVTGGAFYQITKRREKWGQESKKYIEVALS